jgi:putative ABC transport system permease protein
MSKDLRFAWRMISTHRWFSAAVIATIALGIGLNTMVFTLVNAVLFKPVAVQGGKRLVAILNEKHTGRNSETGVSYPDFRDYRTQASSLESLEATTGEEAVLSEQGNPPQAFSMERVTSGLFHMLHTSPALGRSFTTSDDRPGAEPVILLGYGIWKDRYAKDPNIAGHVVRLNGKPATIIGVMPEGFKFPSNQDLWTPLVSTADLEKRSERPLSLYGMLKPGVRLSQATAELHAIAERLAGQYPDTNKDVDVLVLTFHERFNGGPIRAVFLLMLAAVGFVLLIACANVANMMLSHAMTRRSEISIRAAMGASPWHIVRQLLIESVLLSTIGGVLGLALAAWGIHSFDLVTQDVGKPYWIVFRMDYTVFAYFAALCTGSGLLFGLFPALRASRVDLSSALKDGTRSAGTHRGGRLSSGLVVFQFAATVVLLSGAGVFVRAILDAQKLNPIVPADQLLTARIRLPESRYPDAASRVRFHERLQPLLKAIPGVTQVAMGSDLPGMGSGSRGIEIQDTPLGDPAKAPSADVVAAWPGYFTTVDVPILAGRDFNDLDGTPGHRVAIVSREFADRFWPRQQSLGKRFRLVNTDKPTEGNEWFSVVGVSAKIVQNPGSNQPNPLLYLPYRQEAYQSAVLVLRSPGPASQTSAVRAAVQSLDQDLPLSEVRTLTAAIERAQWYLWVFGTLFSVFAVIALVMAAIGIYAVLSQATAQRTREIGVRMALGATSAKILRMVLARGAVQLGIGLTLGLLAAFPGTRLLTSLPLGVSSTDPAIFTGVSVLLTVVGLFASWLPAQRAAALEPVSALREE